MKLSDLVISKCNIRESSDEDDRSGLVESIKNEGLISNIVLRPAEEEGKFEVVAGQRRYLSLCDLYGEDHELDESDYVIKDDLPDDRAFMLSLVENQYRRDLSPMELCTAALWLNKEGKSDKEAAEALNISMAKLKRVQTLKQDARRMPEEARKELTKPSKESRFTEAHWDKLKKVDDPDVVKDAVDYIMSHEAPARDVPGILTGIERQYGASGDSGPSAGGNASQTAAPADDMTVEDALAAGKAIMYDHKGDLTLIEEGGKMSFRVAGKGEDEEVPIDHYLEYLRHPDKFKCSITLKLKIKPLE